MKEGYTVSNNTALWTRANKFAEYIRSLRDEHEKDSDAYNALDDALADFMTVAEDIDRITQNAVPAGSLRVTWCNSLGDNRQAVDSVEEAKSLIRSLRTQHRVNDMGSPAFGLETYKNGTWATWYSKHGETIAELMEGYRPLGTVL